MTATRAFRSFATVFATALVAFVFVAAGALSTFRLAGVALAFPFGLLVGVAERAALAGANRPVPNRFVLRSGAAFLAWAAVSGLVLSALVFRVAALDRWSGLLLLAFVCALAGAVASAAVETRPPLRCAYFAGMIVARVAAVMVAVVAFRAGQLYAGLVAGAAAYAVVFTFTAG